MNGNGFNPSEYRSAEIATEGELVYRVSDDGIVTGRKDIEGARADMVAGIPMKYVDEVTACMHSWDVSFANAIERYGQEPAPGMHLAMLFDNGKTKYRRFPTGVVTPSRITKVKRLA